MPLRSSQGYDVSVLKFIQNEILVVCPKCSKQALVFNFKGPLNNEYEQRFTCKKCGNSKAITEHSPAVLFSSTDKSTEYILVGTSVDPFFHLPLWLTINCGNNTLWAYNYEHLFFLKSHIEAHLRERNKLEMQNSSLGSRLPKWMTSSRNRTSVLKAITKLQKK